MTTLASAAIAGTTDEGSLTVGDLLRQWRQRRHLSQLALAGEADVSARHLSFVETGRAQPSREMVLHLAECLDIPLRARNVLLMAAGYAPTYPERALDDPALREARRVMDLVLAGHEPYPALAVDRHWTLLAANRAAQRLLQGAAPELMRPPVNVLRLSLHPSGLASHIVNFAEWRAHALHRLRQQIEATADPTLSDLLCEIREYRMENGAVPAPTRKPDTASIVVPLQLRTDSGVLSLVSTTTVFGTPRDITLAEIALETFFPADAASATLLQRMADEATQS